MLNEESRSLVPFEYGTTVHKPQVYEQFEKDDDYWYFNFNFERPTFKVNSVPYSMIQIVPESRIQNKSFDEIPVCFHSLYVDLKRRLKREGLDFTLDMIQPIYFEILMEGGKDITFNIAVDTVNANYMKHRMETILPNSDFIFVDDYMQEFEGCPMFTYDLVKHYMCSLETNHEKSHNKSVISLKKDLLPGDKLLISVEIVPIGEDWKNSVFEAQKKLKGGVDVLNRYSLMDRIMETLNGTTDFVVEMIDQFMELKPTKEKEDIFEKMSRSKWSSLSSASRQKTNYDGFKVQVRAMIKTQDESAVYTLGKSMETALKDISADNEFKMSKQKVVTERELNRKLNPIAHFNNNNILSTLELAQFVKFPDGAMQKKFGIRSINFRQVMPPADMTKGKVKIGNAYKNGFPVPVYVPENRDIMCLPMFILTKMGSGKTTLLLNMANDAIKAKHGLVVFDYIRDCDLAHGLCDLHPETLQIRFDDIDQLVSFAFPELEVDENDTLFKRKDKANTIGNEVIYLLNAMATDTEPLSRIMSSYLKSACKVVFIHKGQTLKNVYDVLEDQRVRNRYIQKAIDEGVFEVNDYEIQKLLELNNQNGNNNNAMKRIEGLLDRFSVIMDDTLFQEMMKQPYEHNINFVDVMDKGIPVAVFMPQKRFTNKIAKDVIVTYFLSRIRLAMSMRKDYDKVAHVIIDEGHQVQNALNFLSDTIAEPRKFALNYIISLHSFSQIKNDKVREQVLDVGCNFMILKGSTETAFKELKTYIGDYFDYEDLADMNYRFGSLNLFNVNNRYEPFISELPEPLKNSRGKLYIS